MKEIISALVVLAILFFVVQFYNVTYVIPENNSVSDQQTVNTEKRNYIPKKLVIVVTDSQRKIGKEVTGLSLGVSEIALVRAIGEILSTSLVSIGRKYFKSVELVTSVTSSNDDDIIVSINTWKIGKDTGFDYKGLPMLIGYGNAYATLFVDVEVNSKKIKHRVIKETEKGMLESGLMLFPVPRINRTMTEAFDLAARNASEKITEKIVYIWKSLNASDKMLAHGASVYMNGVRDMIGCVPCHGEYGEENKELFVPKLNGMNESQVRSALKEYRTGTRQDEKMFIMNNIANKLTQKDIDGISIYISSIPRFVETIPEIQIKTEENRNVSTFGRIINAILVMLIIIILGYSLMTPDEKVNKPLLGILLVSLVVFMALKYFID